MHKSNVVIRCCSTCKYGKLVKLRGHGIEGFDANNRAMYEDYIVWCFTCTDTNVLQVRDGSIERKTILEGGCWNKR